MVGLTLPRTLDHGLRIFPALWQHQLVGVADGFDELHRRFLAD